jgi:hypothetical protein
MDVSGDASLISVASLADATASEANLSQRRTIWDARGGGVMIYNTKLGTIAGGPVTLGGGSGFLLLKPFFDPVSVPPDAIEKYNNISIFQDRTLTTDVTLNGSTADGEVAGIIYVPGGHVQINGSSSTFIVDQIIADTFKINGNGGTIEVLRRAGVDATIIAAGLVD